MKKRTLIMGIMTMIMWNIIAAAEKFDHSLFDAILQKYVSQGWVDYAALQKNHDPLTEYLTKLERVDANEFKNWATNEQKAFWINAYNALTLEAILQNYPIQYGGLLARARFPKSSIRQIRNVWDRAWHKVMGKDLTLNQIEHEILRKKFADPRIHFVLVCASVGCPKLENRAFQAENLDQRLDAAAKKFIMDAEKVRLNKNKNQLFLSSIFDWYRGDFSNYQSEKLQNVDYSKEEKFVLAFIFKYLPKLDQEYILKNQPKIKFLNYDWSLNEKK
ncbi:MAG: DUF547 domain-containing protein [Calditrichaeota bacterium]|nr:DUF547 domain-containing protein [Calditrichota bacterium]